MFLAAKVEEQPRKLEHVVKIAHACINPQEPALDTKSNVSVDVAGQRCLKMTPSTHPHTHFCGDGVFMSLNGQSFLFQAFQQQAQELVALETVVLQTLGE